MKACGECEMGFDPISHGGRILWLPLKGGGSVEIYPGYQGRSHFRPYIVKSYFETYKNHDHMQKLTEISGFQNL